ncbi:uncharacterized protein FIESC28_04012 [Fusarium coffeatum]|uniref:Uncharacterized protein n=1 Tax=Fusarium coffeatum TaxID=231269 RepID=A0A366S3M6_9HYPO|nr:uncharacterized protein FIESC28_04012 [Fusarium coffeatum]RBR23270.1 hypothetical protein FIESC28_04012 [Fusarium coffeatum]
MFAQQHASFEQRKRGREDDELAANGMSFGEHRNKITDFLKKRLQCLPLRALPRTSSASQDQGYSDMNMMQAQTQQGSDRLSMMQMETDCNSNGRMPTPIQPSFAAQVRGQQAHGPNGVANLGHQNTGFHEDQSVPRTMAGGWQAAQNERRLPSPICEDDNTMACEPITPVNNRFDASVHISPGMEHPNVRVEPSPPHDVEHHMMDVEEPHESDPSPPRRGHIRSRHTVNNWTWQPGMKKSFSIGFRSDCEKCRLKVPGHFNHIIVS